MKKNLMISGWTLIKYNACGEGIDWYICHFSQFIENKFLRVFKKAPLRFKAWALVSLDRDYIKEIILNNDREFILKLLNYKLNASPMGMLAHRYAKRSCPNNLKYIMNKSKIKKGELHEQIRNN